MARVLQTHEPEGRLVYRLADGQEAVVLQDARLALAQGAGDADPLLPVQHDSAEVVVHRVRLVEAQGVLRDHV